MHTGGLPGWMRRHPRLTDLALVVVVLLPSALATPTSTPDAGPGSVVGWPGGLLLLLACAALVLRRRWPLLTWGVTVGLALLMPLAGEPAARGIPPVLAAVYAVAAGTTRRSAVLVGGATAALTLAVVASSGVTGWTDPAAWAVVSWCGMAAAVGDAVRSNREVLAAAVERAERAEEERDAQARRQVVQERLRLSRELHDVVAHHVAAVNVQAGVAEHLVVSDPEQASAALVQVRSSTSAALTEMQALVGLLRTGDESPDLAPAPGAEDIDGLVDSLRSRGTVVTHRHTGPPLDVAPATGRHLYRVVQEALTNAARHGDGQVELVTEQGASSVTIRVSNPVRGAPGPSGGGHGLVGMRERVTLCGGRLTAGPTGQGTFEVVAVLPREAPAP